MNEPKVRSETPIEADAVRRIPRAVSLMFAAAACGASACLFLVELVAGKLLLPLCGGAPAVWITCLAFFQITLVVAYVHAARHVRRHPEAWQTAVQALLFVAAAVTSLIVLRSDALVGLVGRWPVGSRALVILTVAVGPAFFALAALTPLFGHWRGCWPAERNATMNASYGLYAAGNVGSFAALVAYPLLIEPALGVRLQLGLIGMLYALVGIVAVACGGITARSVGSTRVSAAEPLAGTSSVGWATWGRWVLLAAVPSAWLAGVTTYATTKVAPLPLLWVAPLAAYLASFAVVFSPWGRRWTRCEPVAVLLAVGGAAWLIAGEVTSPTWPVIGAHVLALFIVGIGLHGRLVDERPSIPEQSSFYVALAIGGAAGGLCNAVIAPALFDAHHEFPLAIAVAAGLVLGGGRDGGHAVRYPLAAVSLALIWGLVWASPGGISIASIWWLAAVGVTIAVSLVMLDGWWRTAALAALLVATFTANERSDGVVYRSRTFFGVLRVCEIANGPSRTLVHGSIAHGVQLVSDDPERRRIPLSYYAEAGPLGSIYKGLTSVRPLRRVGIAGLGIGTVAAYAEPGQEYVFFEIDPEVVRIAHNPDWFTFLADCRGDVRVVVDDARFALEREPESGLDLLVVDAFTGDSVPTHLLTREALALYGRTLAPDGVLALHVSNTYLDFVPVVERLAADGGWMALQGRDADVPPEFARSPSEWMVLSRSLDVIKAIYAQPTSDRWRWRPCAERPSGRPWTDDHTAVTEAVRR